MEDRIEKWRMILGQKADPEGELKLNKKAVGMDKALDALYDSNRKKGLGKSSPNVNRWLGDIRRYFPTTMVQLMQKDALERLQLDQMLLEPELLESVEADVELVGTLLALKNVVPEKTKETARIVVKKVVEDLEKKLHHPMRQALHGSLNRSLHNRRPKLNEINWQRTIQANLKHYQPSLKTIIPEQLRGYGRQNRQLNEVFLLVDQSGSMATSVVYAGILGCIMASLRSLKTRMVVFDTSVVDLTDHLHDPVDLLFATQLGGGTDINRALTYIGPHIGSPSNTILVLISDLFEGGNEKEMLQRLASFRAAGVQIISLLALNDQGAPNYDKHVAAQLSQLDVPAFACTPDLFPDLMASALKKEDLRQWMGRNGVVGKN